ncbi:two-component regulator propeller domain-containing protein [Winogradskyella sp.]|uniref:Periplasmic ligand-binding sensor domain-containing protein n=1 Tax=Winogradskyella sp. TaxID=1883156 RepID=UPI0025F5CF51|nr:two-component regulator propeller domain-containing protein [Winogradskyella sp.]
MKKAHIITLLLAVCVSLNSLAQKRDLEYSQKLTISEGLAHNGVTSILEDSNGFIWFGTYAGINKYDGYELRTFKNTIDQDLLTSNRVRTLKEDEKDNVWIGTDEGVTIYNHTSERFEKLISDKLVKLGFNSSIIRDIIINDDGVVLCVTQKNGVFVFNDEDYSLLGQYKHTSSEVENINFFKGVAFGESNYLITSSIGLLNFDVKTKIFSRVLENDIQYCNSIIQLKENSFLVTLLNGVAVVEVDTKSSKSDLALKHINFKDNQFNSALLDSAGKLWLGTLNEGVIVINDTEAFRLEQATNHQKFTDNLPRLRSSYIVETSQNSCWLATFNEGIYRFDEDTSPFFNYNINMNDENGIASNNVTHITVLDEDRVYMTSSFGGLALFNSSKKAFERLPFYLSKSMASRVGAVFVDSKGNTWLKLNEENTLRRHVKGIIEEQNNSDWDAILIYKTEFVTVEELNALQAYLDNGGTVIIDTISLQQNEYGQNHTMSLNASNGTIIQAPSIGNIKTQAFGLLSNDSELPDVILDETNVLNEKGCFWRTVTNEEGKEVITIINIGKENAQITLSLRSNVTIDSITNLLTGQATTTTFTMAPDDVLLLEVVSESLSIDEMELDEFKYYPNPTSGIINFEANKTIEKTTVYNILGQEVINLKGETNSLQLDIENYPQGIYLVKLSIQGQVKTVSIIKK